jgi:hypothetical protein
MSTEGIRFAKGALCWAGSKSAAVDDKPPSDWPEAAPKRRRSQLNLPPFVALEFVGTSSSPVCRDINDRFRMPFREVFY